MCRSRRHHRVLQKEVRTLTSGLCREVVGSEAADVLRQALEQRIVMVTEVSAGPCGVRHILVVEAP